MTACADCLQGPSVVNAIDAFKPSERATQKPFRMPISDVFKGQRGGISVGGKLEGGAVQVGSAVRVLPSNEVATVKSVEVDGAAAPAARAGDTADLTLAGDLQTDSLFCARKVRTAAVPICWLALHAVSLGIEGREVCCFSVGHGHPAGCALAAHVPSMINRKTFSCTNSRLVHWASCLGLSEVCVAAAVLKQILVLK